MVTASGDHPWVGTNTYSFALNYDAVTGVATFQVTGTGYNSGVLSTSSLNYGLAGYGFSGIDIGLKDRETGTLTSLTVSNLMLNGSSIGSPSYSGPGTYTVYALYAGQTLGSINLTGNFVMTGDYVGNNEGTKFDLYLRNAAPVPEPVTLVLFGTGLAAVGVRRRTKTRA